MQSNNLIYWPVSDFKNTSISLKLAYSLLGSVALALLSQVVIPLPFTPVPITGQTFGLFLLAAYLGPYYGALSVCFYFSAAMLGLPVLASGAFGMSAFIGVTAGYLVGFMVSSFLMGLLFQTRLSKSFFGLIGIFTLGLVPVYLFGLIWLSSFIPSEQVLMAGLIPFLPGAGIKILSAALFFQKTRRLGV